MNNQSCIFWFSGTGNSLYAAKQLAAQLDNIPLMQITDKGPSGTVGGIGAKIGFVFPSFYENLPCAVRAFVEKLDIQPDTYIFCVVTMGGIGLGSVAALESALKAKGLCLEQTIKDSHDISSKEYIIPLVNFVKGMSSDT